MFRDAVLPIRCCPDAAAVNEKRLQLTSLRDRIEARIEDRRAAGLEVLPARVVAARLDACLACESFAGDRCGDIRGCDSPEKWIRRIASGTCEGWR